MQQFLPLTTFIVVIQQLNNKTLFISFFVDQIDALYIWATEVLFTPSCVSFTDFAVNTTQEHLNEGKTLSLNVRHMCNVYGSFPLLHTLMPSLLLPVCVRSNLGDLWLGP